MTLQAIQAELKAPKGRTNSFGKYQYRSCEDILEAVKPLLAKHNCKLIITDEVIELANTVIIKAKAVFTDEAGVVTEVTANAGVDMNKKGMDISQSFGASGSYARKYALNGLFLIDDTKDADSNEYHHQMQNQAQRQTPKQKTTLDKARFEKAVEAVKNGQFDKVRLLNEYALTAEQLEIVKGL